MYSAHKAIFLRHSFTASAKMLAFNIKLVWSVEILWNLSVHQKIQVEDKSLSRNNSFVFCFRRRIWSKTSWQMIIRNEMKPQAMQRTEFVLYTFVMAFYVKIKW